MTIATAEPVFVRKSIDRSHDSAVARPSKTFLTAIWVVLLLVAGEGALRLRAWYRHGTNGPVADIYETDELLGRRPRPGAILSGSERNLSINRWGFRGREIPKAKPPGTTRIVAVGDSTTFGMEASRDDAVWVARMVDLLKDSGGGGCYDAINAGVPGYSLATCAVQLTRRLLPFDPDIAIVFATAGDVLAHTKRQFPRPAAESAGESALTAFVFEHSLLLNLIRLNTTAYRTKQIPQKRHDRLNERGVIRYMEQLERVIETCRQHELRLILCTTPRAFGDATAPTDQYTLAQTALAHNTSLSLAGLNDAYARYNDAVRRTAHKHGVTLVDLDAIVPKRRHFFADAVHFKDAGHELVAQAIARAVIDCQSRDRQARGRP